MFLISTVCAREMFQLQTSLQIHIWQLFFTVTVNSCLGTSQNWCQKKTKFDSSGNLREKGDKITKYLLYLLLHININYCLGYCGDAGLRSGV